MIVGNPGKEHGEKAGGRGGRNPENDPSEKPVAPDDSDDSCRCKEVSEKTPSEMLRLMLHDLSFWKRGKGKIRRKPAQPE